MHLGFGDLLAKNDINAELVISMRHRPTEPHFKKVLPWLASEKPDMYNAYQQTQGEKVERALEKLVDKGQAASFIGHEAGKALFVGMYEIGETSRLTYNQYWKIPAYIEMKQFGMGGFKKSEDRNHILWFEMNEMDQFKEYKGRLVISWPPPERSWWRRTQRNDFRILEIKAESYLNPDMPEWDQLILTWSELKVMPSSWKAALSQWRGIYYIFDEEEQRGYVGSAYGSDNICGRWTNYSTTGHGGNKHLKKLNPDNFKFSILQRVSPDLPSEEVIRLESSWKERLHTRHPYGLNDN